MTRRGGNGDAAAEGAVVGVGTGRRALLRWLAIGLVGVLGVVAGCSSHPDYPARGGAGSASRPGAPATPSAPPASPAAATVVPLTLEGRPPRLVAHVEIGGADLRVVVDTGSTGLRVAAATVPATAAAVQGPARPYGYGSGLLLQGRLAHAPARVGSASTPAMPLELVDSTSCTSARPDCAADEGRTPDLMGGTFDGILGLSPAAGPSPPNPLWSLGAVGHAYTLHVDPGAGSTLALGAPPDGFVVTPLPPAPGRTAPPEVDGPPGWQPRPTICARAAFLPDGTACLPTVFDTGTPPLANIYAPGASPASAPPGSAVTFSTPDGRWSVATTSQRGAGANIPRSGLPGRSGTTIVGLPLFARTDVRFDLAAGTIGLRAR